MFNTELGLFCNLHEDWVELLTHEPYCLKIKEDDNYVMFCYDQIRSDFKQTLVQEARGIIFRKGEWTNPVCWAFNKFGNYGESWVPDLDWDTAFVTEKVDGSLIKVWYDCGWHISTNGAIDAFDAKTSDVRMPDFGTYFITAICDYGYFNFIEFTGNLNENLTYMFELVGPYNRVVIPYDKPDVYFLGARNKFTGEEFSCAPGIVGALGLGRFKRPKVYPLTSLSDCVKATEAFSWDQEGFVVCDANFNRVKIKSPSYVLAHYTRNNNVITRRHLIRVILENELEEFMCYADDYKDVLLETHKLMRAFINTGNMMAQTCRKLILLDKKDYAEVVKTYPTIYQGLLFCNYDKFMSMQAYTQNWSETKWEEYLDNFESFTKSLYEENT